MGVLVLNLTKVDISKQGTLMFLGTLEYKILKVIWEQGFNTVTEVHKYIRDNLPPEEYVAYTTVSTCMIRLAEKGILAILPNDYNGSKVFDAVYPTEVDFINVVVYWAVLALVAQHGGATEAALKSIYKQKGALHG